MSAPYTFEDDVPAATDPTVAELAYCAADESCEPWHLFPEYADVSARYCASMAARIFEDGSLACMVGVTEPTVLPDTAMASDGAGMIGAVLVAAAILAHAMRRRP